MDTDSVGNKGAMAIDQAFVKATILFLPLKKKKKNVSLAISLSFQVAPVLHIVMSITLLI